MEVDGDKGASSGSVRLDTAPRESRDRTGETSSDPFHSLSEFLHRDGDERNATPSNQSHGFGVFTGRPCGKAISSWTGAPVPSERFPAVKTRELYRENMGIKPRHKEVKH